LDLSGLVLAGRLLSLSISTSGVITQICSWGFLHNGN
jgi:hypothetical protein